MDQKQVEDKASGLAVIIHQSDSSDKTVSRFVGVVSITLTSMTLKTDQTLSQFPLPVTIYRYNFAEKFWQLHQGIILSCRQAENPGNFLLDVTLQPENHEQEMILHDPRVQEIMEKMDFFVQLEFFTRLSHNTFWAVLSRLAPVSFHEGETIVGHGVRGEAIYFIEQGGCYIIVDREGQEYEQSTRKRGDMVGVMALLTDESRPATVVAATEVKLWRLARDCFTLLVEEHFELQKFLTGLVCERLEAEGRTADLAIGKYTIDHQLGKGAWAIVYLGHHRTLGRHVAIKLLKHQIAIDPDFRDRFVLEAKIIAEMQHRNIVNIYDVEERFSMLFIIMEYLEGTPVDLVLKRKGRLPVAQVVEILIQVCSGLSYAHERGIVHQDIKPDNLFMLKSGQVKILDFGLACPFGTENIEMEGTLPYMSPEQIDSYPVDARTDLYGLGITAFELLTSRKPHPDDDLAALRELHLNKDIPDPREFAKNTPPLLAEFIKTCCRRNPDERYQDVATALKVLMRLKEQSIDCVQPSVPQNMSSLYLFYDDEQRGEVTELLEEFALKVQAHGLRLQLAEFNQFLYQ
ncbi:MAG: protein kinase [Thermodesulfobacteriota bacterium]|nr:protein kinase [Thermodesulfobacteriota bacterium]